MGPDDPGLFMTFCIFYSEWDNKAWRVLSIIWLLKVTLAAVWRINYRNKRGEARWSEKRLFQKSKQEIKVVGLGINFGGGLNWLDVDMLWRLEPKDCLVDSKECKKKSRMTPRFGVWATGRMESAFTELEKSVKVAAFEELHEEVCF